MRKLLNDMDYDNENFRDTGIRVLAYWILRELKKKGWTEEKGKKDNISDSTVLSVYLMLSLFFKNWCLNLVLSKISDSGSCCFWLLKQ